MVSPALERSRQYADAWREVANVPFRWTLMTASHSSSVIENSIRSRRIPALLMSTSTPPKVSTACCTIRCPPSQVLMSSVLAIATPPPEMISSKTSCAGPTSEPVPSRPPPTSLTTTLAPSAASIRAYSRPMPRPAPVTMHTRSLQIPDVIELNLCPDNVVGQLLACRSKALVTTAQK